MEDFGDCAVRCDDFWKGPENPDDDDLYGFSSAANGEVWEGWDAALIASKRVYVEQECRQRLRKRKRRKQSKTRRRVLSEKALEMGHWSEATKTPDLREKVWKIAEAVTVFTGSVIENISWLRMKELLPSDKYVKLRNSVFMSAAKFVLSVFDAEDFERLYDSYAINDDYEKFYSTLVHFESVHDSLSAIADGSVDLKKFSALREHDVGEILRRHKTLFNCPELKRIVKGFAWSFGHFPYEMGNVDKNDIELALEAMKQFVPLKGDCKIQSALELLHGTSYHVLDALFLEGWKGAASAYWELRHYLISTFDDNKPDSVGDLRTMDQYGMKPSEVAKSELSKFVCDFKGSLFTVGVLKKQELERCEVAAIFPLRCETFGRFADEVLEVVRVANHERRMQGCRFISLHHILFGLSLSRIGDFVQSNLRATGLNRYAKKLSKIPVYTVYKWSGLFAQKTDEEVVLEHLVLAIFFLIREKVHPSEMNVGKWSYESNDQMDMLLDGLKNVDSKRSVESWKDNFSGLPQECVDGSRVTCHRPYSVEILTQAFANGLQLPEIR